MMKGTSVGFIHKESIAMHGHTIVKFKTSRLLSVYQSILPEDGLLRSKHVADICSVCKHN